MKINVFVTLANGMEKLFGMGYTSIDSARTAGQLEVKRKRAVKYRLARG